VLSKRQRLLMQQLRLRAWAEDRGDGSEPKRERMDAPVGEPLFSSWNLTRGVDLNRWQQEASEAWFAAGYRGTIKVVTGAGKTLCALAIAERLQREVDPELRVAIVVPTIVLMNQWRSAFARYSNLPQGAVGALGGGHGDHFDNDRRVLVAVLATARKELPRLVRSAGVGEHLLLIADECHRVGAPEMSAVLNTPRAYSLGLSATPEREADESDGSGDGGAAVDRIGPIVYEMTFADAIRQQILPPFELHHYGLPLAPKEAQKYSSLSRSITDLRRELLASSPAARKAGGERLLAWARRVSSRSSAGISGLAARYVSDTRERKQLLYRAESRKAATLALIQDALKARADARVILFHESIAEVEALFDLLVKARVPAVMEHSELPQELRETSLDLFRSGGAQVIVSARSLIEGFDVPEADLGIIVASSSSPRQRIQSVGRVLRRYRDASGEQKTSRVCVLYIRDTVDEAIYEKEDWAKLIGLDRNRYFLWDPPAPPVEQGEPPRQAIPSEREIDFANLRPGDVYPGRYEGDDYSADSLGNVIDADGRIANNPGDVPAKVEQIRGQPGRFRVTPSRRAILVLRSRDGGWETIFAGTLQEPFDFQAQQQANATDTSALSPGDRYRGPVEPAEELRYRQRAGGTISRRTRRGEAFAQGAEAERLVAILRDLTRSAKITKLFVNERGDVFWREAGVPRFVATLDGELEFPRLEEK
jgi:superfamily II DNA or RNA helicase